MAAVIVLIGALGAWSVVNGASNRTAEIARVDELDGVLADLPDPSSADHYPAVNYLLVGSDSREGVDPSDPDYAALGSETSFGGRRSDTIMVLRQEADGALALMSLPRDLWIEIAGTGRSQRINTAYSDGPEQLAATVSQTLGIPVHHFVEVDFAGFKGIVDELGGVEICTDGPARDHKSLLDLPGGCTVLDGVQALAYARSRYYQEWDGDSWVSDPRGDLGRNERQQAFLRAAASGVIKSLKSDPFGLGDMISSVIGSVRVDSRLDPFEAAESLRSALDKGLHTYSLPVYNDTVGDAAVLRLGDGAESLFAYFRGDGPAPTEYETSVDTEPNTG